MDHLLDLLSLHIFQVSSFGPYAALLDQHGGDGDFDSSGIDLNTKRAFGGVPAGHASLSEGFHDAFLGDCDLVDSNAADLGVLASCLQAIPFAIRPALLGRCVPVGDVQRVHKASLTSISTPVPGLASQDVRICGPCSVAVNLCRIPGGTEVTMDAEAYTD